MYSAQVKIKCPGITCSMAELSFYIYSAGVLKRAIKLVTVCRIITNVKFKDFVYINLCSLKRKFPLFFNIFN